MSRSKSAEAKAAKPKKENLVVFAFRLSEADRDAIHKAAGPGKATRFVLAAALAAAQGDHTDFQKLVDQANANLKQ